MNELKTFLRDIINVGKTRKFWVVTVGAVIAALSVEYADQAWVQWVVLLATALGVYRVPNNKK